MLTANASYLEELYEEYLKDPSLVPDGYRSYFSKIGEETPLSRAPLSASSKEYKIFNLIEAYRRYGHLLAAINPLSSEDLPLPYELNLERLGFYPEELDELFPSHAIMEEEESTLYNIILRLKEIYCKKIGVQYRHIEKVEIQQWLQRVFEKEPFPTPFSTEEKERILHQLNKSSLFEIFLHTKYVGQKRFSLEGGESLIPLLHEIMERGAHLGMKECVIGMPHRGRLNVLANILNKSYSMIFSEFEDFYDPSLTQGLGDVKYHRGFSSEIATQSGQIHVALTANPSHLESIDPVVEGKTRAKQVWSQDHEKSQIVPLLIHGDAAIAGQGVVYETLQLYNLEAYSTGGTIHIVVNNQIGFTTLPKDERSTRYATDIAKSFSAPIFHVNAEDPEGCVYAARLAIELRQRFHCDVFIDLNCYRKYGHNESDEPAFTQPLQYEIIRKKAAIREIYQERLIQEGVMSIEKAAALEERFKQHLHTALEEFKLSKNIENVEPFQGIWEKYRPAKEPDLLAPFPTSVSREEVEEVTRRFCAIPTGFSLHPKVAKLFKERQEALTKGIDWALAEYIAFGTLLWEGVPVRLVGQDSRRGTFSQRHAVWMDQKTGEEYFPLKNLKEKQGRFDVYDSLLSEFAALGFEFGYSLSFPSALTLWEAQYGDFANGGQVVFDQYISSSEEKWQRLSGLTILLPHGYEGQGPEHSSGRIERFLQLAGDNNMQITFPTTPAQYFHLLRRQVLRPIRKPLIVFTPKSMLRNPLCISNLSDFAQGAFQELLDDIGPLENVRRILFCTGKIYYTLLAERNKRGVSDIALIRLEQLYPLHKERIAELVKKYGAKELFFVQEEPQNMGGWSYISPLLQEVLQSEILYVGRARRGAPATGFHPRHLEEEKEILEKAFK